MITAENILGPSNRDDPDKIILTLKANNGVASRYSLFALNLKHVPESIELHGRVYERHQGSLDFIERPPPSPAAELPRRSPKKKNLRSSYEADSDTIM